MRAFLPEAVSAWVIDLSQGEPGKSFAMERVRPEGFFTSVFPGRSAAFPYRLRVENHEGHSWEFVDPYSFGPVLSDFDLHLLAEGTHYRNYERLGAHLRTHRGFAGVHFAVWAPNAQRVSVIGNFNHWDGRRHPMGNRGAIGDLGALHPRPVPGRGLQVRGQEPTPRLPRRKIGSLRLRRGDAAKDGVRRVGRHGFCLA